MAKNSGLNFILKILQICGLGPYLFSDGRQERFSRIFCITYNLSLVAALIYSISGFVNNSRTGSGCTLRSKLMRLSFDIADLMENVHIMFVSLRCLVFLGKGKSLWLNLLKADDKFKELDAEFHQRRFMLYLYVKTSLYIGLYLIFLKANDTVLGFHDLHDSTYHRLYVLPLTLSILLDCALSSLIVMLNQRFWVINQFLKSFLKYYCDKKLTMALRQLDRLGPDEMTKKSTGTFRTTNFPFLWRSVRNKISPSARRRLAKPPLWTMVKGSGFSFGNFDGRRQQNLVDFIRKLKVLHFRLYEVTDSLNSVFGYNFLFIFGTSFFGCIINLYFVAAYYLRSDQSDQYTTCLYWLFYYMFRITHVIFCVNSTTKQAGRTQDLLHLILNHTTFTDVALQEELKTFCLQICKCKVRFQAAGFFDVDLGAFFHFIAGVFSNVLFTIQFNKMELKAIENANETDEMAVIKFGPISDTDDDNFHLYNLTDTYTANPFLYSY